MPVVTKREASFIICWVSYSCKSTEVAFHSSHAPPPPKFCCYNGGRSCFHDYSAWEQHCCRFCNGPAKVQLISGDGGTRRGDTSDAIKDDTHLYFPTIHRRQLVHYCIEKGRAFTFGSYLRPSATTCEASVDKLAFKKSRCIQKYFRNKRNVMVNNVQ